MIILIILVKACMIEQFGAAIVARLYYSKPIIYSLSVVVYLIAATSAAGVVYFTAGGAYSTTGGGTSTAGGANSTAEAATEQSHLEENTI